MKQTLLWCAVLFALTTLLQAANIIYTDSYTVSIGPGKHAKAVTVITSCTVTREAEAADSLLNATGWVVMDLGRLTTPDEWFIDIDCDSCSEENVAELRLINDEADTLDMYIRNAWAYHAPGDSAHTITQVALRNPTIGDTTAAGTAVTFFYSFGALD